MSGSDEKMSSLLIVLSTRDGSVFDHSFHVSRWDAADELQCHARNMGLWLSDPFGEDEYGFTSGVLSDSRGPVFLFVVHDIATVCGDLL